MAVIVLRGILLLVSCFLAVAFKPLALSTLGPASLVILNLLLGLAVGGLALTFEWYLRTAPLRTIVGGITGVILGAVMASALLRTIPPGLIMRGWPVAPDLMRPIVYLLLVLVGMMVGAHKGGNFRADRVMAMLRPAQERRTCKLLDTSVIIDGRIVDICETGFLDGVLVVPQFVLRELQYVADSSDPLKRNRGRKGLEILQRIKKCPEISVMISDADFPEVREVDDKLIELALQIGAKIITNDFNLNKVAQLRGVEVLNINELANSLKPVVLPGETMKVFILKEGKEPNQGVAYLDDGTMVVVDNARKQLGKTVEIIVTSVLQTTAGKMFFGRSPSELERGQLPRRPIQKEQPEARETVAVREETAKVEKPVQPDDGT